LGAKLRRAASESEAWEVDVPGVAIVFDDDPAARPGAVLVVAHGLVLYTELLRRPPSEHDELAAEMARQVAKAGERLGVAPRRVVVRHAAVAELLGERLAELGVEVEVGPLDDLDHAADSLRAHLSGTAGRSVGSSSPLTWAGWELGEARCASLFEAAAEYYRRAPWKVCTDADPLELTGPSGDRWFGFVLGGAGLEFGIALYDSEADVEETLSTGESEEFPERFHGQVISLIFEPGSELPKEMRREVSRAGWEVASAEAYPQLIALNTPGGGITRRQIGDLVAILRAVPAFVERYADEIEIGTATEAFEAAGVRVALLGVDDGVPAPPVGRLRPGGARGPRARPEAVLEASLAGGAAEADLDAIVEREMEVVVRFGRALEREGLSAKTVLKHVDNAGTFVQFLAFHAGVPLVAVHEYDLRFFLYDWFPRQVRTSRSLAMTMPGSLRRFVRYLAKEEGLDLPTAEEVLAEKDYYEQRWDSFPDGHWWDEEVGGWCWFAWRDLRARALTHDDGLGDGEWGRTMGVVEAQLESELQRRWLLWRDALIEEGVTDPAELRRRLVDHRRIWESAPHERLDGKTPLEAIAAERKRREARERENRPRGDRG
jgi:hypothetical protein